MKTKTMGITVFYTVRFQKKKHPIFDLGILFLFQLFDYLNNLFIIFSLNILEIS